MFLMCSILQYEYKIGTQMKTPTNYVKIALKQCVKMFKVSWIIVSFSYSIVSFFIFINSDADQNLLVFFLHHNLILTRFRQKMPSKCILFQNT